MLQLPCQRTLPVCTCPSQSIRNADAYLAILSYVSVFTSFLIIEEAPETIVNSFSNRARHDFTPCIVREHVKEKRREASPDDQQDIKKLLISPIAHCSFIRSFDR